MHRRDVERDVFDRLHTARAVHEKHPGYRVNVSSNPHTVMTLPEYEKHLMSHLG
jgi:carbamoylphosphate synthase large subunit